MAKYKIPEFNDDLKRFARWKNLKYLLGYVAYCAFLSVAFWFFVTGRYEDAPPLMWWVYPLYALLVLVSGWFIFCMNRFVFDKSCSGSVRSISVTRSFDRGLSRGAGFRLDFHTYIKILIVDENGKKKKVKAQLFEDGYDGYFEEGDTVVKFRGLNYPLCLESEGEGAHLCSVCGVRTYYLEGRMPDGSLIPEMIDGHIVCRACGHTMINIAELEKK